MTLYNKVESKGRIIGFFAGIILVFCIWFLVELTNFIYELMLPTHPLLSTLLFFGFWMWFLFFKSIKAVNDCFDFAEKIVEWGR